MRVIGSNIGGIQSIVIAPASQVTFANAVRLQMPAAQLSSMANVYRLPIVRQKSNFNEFLGITYSCELSFAVAKQSTEMIKLAKLIRSGKWVCWLTDNNNYTRIIGNNDNPLRFVVQETTDSISGFNHLVFSAEYSSPIYTPYSNEVLFSYETVNYTIKNVAYYTNDATLNHAGITKLTILPASAVSNMSSAINNHIAAITADYEQAVTLDASFSQDSLSANFNGIAYEYSVTKTISKTTYNDLLQLKLINNANVVAFVTDANNIMRTIGEMLNFARINIKSTTGSNASDSNAYELNIAWISTHEAYIFDNAFEDEVLQNNNGIDILTDEDLQIHITV